VSESPGSGEEDGTLDLVSDSSDNSDDYIKVVSESPANSGEEDGTPDLTADSSDDSDSSTKLEEVPQPPSPEPTRFKVRGNYVLT
jgi:hypothetical protein